MRKLPGVRHMKTRPPSRDRLRELLDYDPKTGALTWRARTHLGSTWWNNRYAGKPAGSLTAEGYIAVKIDDRNYLAHRLIWGIIYLTPEIRSGRYLLVIGINPLI